MTKVKKITLFASLGLVLTAFVWGLAFVVVKNSLDTLSPIYMLAIRFSIAAVGLCIIFFKKLRKINLNMLKSGVVLGIIIFIGYLLQTIGCKYTTAGKNAFLTAVYVVMVPFFHWFFNKRKPDIFNIIAAFVAILGIGLISLNGNFEMNIGDILTLICGVSYAIHMVLVDRYTEHQDPIILTIVQMCTSAVLSWICAPIFEGGFPAEALNPDMIGSMLYLGLLSTMLAFLLQLVCQKYTQPSVAALLLSLEAIFGVIFSSIFLKEVVTVKMGVGCAILFFAIIMAETKFDFLRKRGKSECIKKHV